MPITAIFANLACSDLGMSTDWFSTLFGRDADARPMAGLCEWHLGEAAGFQLHEDPRKAGGGTLTLVVSDIEAEYRRLASIGIGTIEEADYTRIARMSDPDGNLVVLAQPKG